MATTRFVATILLWIVSNVCATICRALKAWEWLAAAPRVQVEERQVKKNQETKTIKKTGKGEKKYKSANRGRERERRLTKKNVQLACRGNTETWCERRNRSTEPCGVTSRNDEKGRYRPTTLKSSLSSLITSPRVRSMAYVSSWTTCGTPREELVGPIKAIPHLSHLLARFSPLSRAYPSLRSKPNYDWSLHCLCDRNAWEPANLQDYITWCCSSFISRESNYQLIWTKGVTYLFA